MIHPLVVGEPALGSLRERALQERTKTLALLDFLPQVRVAQLSDVRLMIEALPIRQLRWRPTSQKA